MPPPFITSTRANVHDSLPVFGILGYSEAKFPGAGRRFLGVQFVLGYRSRRSAVLAFLVALMLVACAQPAAYASAVSTVPQRTWGTDGRVFSLAKAGQSVFVTGNFSHLVNPATGATLVAGNVAALDATTGQPVSTFSVGTNGAILAAAVSPDGNTLYLAGTFSKINGKPRSRLAAVTTTTGALLPWAPAASASVHAILPLATKVIIGGDFTQLDGTAVKRIGAVDTAKGALVPGWSATASCRVQALAVSQDGTQIYAGGYAQYWDGIDRPGLARLSAATGALDSSFNAQYLPNSKLCDPVHTHDGMNPFEIAVGPYALLVAVGGLRNDLDALNFSGSVFWRDRADGDFQTVVMLGNDIYAGGHFVNEFIDRCGTHQAPVHLIKIDALGGCQDTSWVADMTTPNKSGHFYGVWTLLTDGGSLYVGGEFQRTYTVVNGKGRTYQTPSYAVFPAS